MLAQGAQAFAVDVPQALCTVQNLSVRVTDSQMTVWRKPRR